MSTELVESIFQLDDPNIIAYNRKKTDYIRIAPTTGTSEYANQSGQINFEINNQQYFLYLPEAFLHCEFDLFRKPAGGAEVRMEPKDNITLEHNFFPKLFTNMQLDVGSGTLETITNPGIYDDMIRFVKFNKSYTDTSSHIQGWIPDTNDGGITKHFAGTAAGTPTKITIKQVKAGVAAGENVDVANPTALEEVYNHLKTGLGANHGFSRRMRLYNTKGHFVSKWKLSPLFGYLDHKKISYQLKYVLRLTRSTDNNPSVFFGDTGFTEEAIIKISKIELWIPQIQPSLTVEAFLNRRLASGYPIPITYMKRHTMSPISVVGEEYSFMIASGVTKTPRYAVVAFKTANNPSVYVNDAMFFLQGKTRYRAATKDWDPASEVQIQQLELQLNNVNYPNQPIRMKYDNQNDYMEAYTEYENMCNIFGIIPQLNPHDWFHLYPIFCFDCSSQNEDLKRGGITLRVNVKFNANPQGNLRAYALLFEDNLSHINVVNGVMTNIE